MTETINIAATNVEDKRSPLSWSAVFAGSLTTIALFSLLSLLGSAIGTSVADGTDFTAVTQGFGIASAVWLIVTGLLSFYAGSYVSGRLAGVYGKPVGLLHGLATWGLASVVMSYLGYTGVSNSLQTLVNTAQSTASAVGSAVNGGVNFSQQAIIAAQNQGIFDRIGSALKEQAIEETADAEPVGGANVSEAELSQAVSSLDVRLATRVATELGAGDTEGAKTILSNETTLTEAEVEETIAGFENYFANGGTNETLSSSLTNSVASSTADITGPSVQQSEVRSTLENLSPKAMQVIATRLITGDVAGAKNSLIANSNLSRSEANTIVDGVEQEVRADINKFQDQMSQISESVGSYLQAALWAAFITGVIALFVSMFGGKNGAAAIGDQKVIAKNDGLRRPRAVND